MENRTNVSNEAKSKANLARNQKWMEEVLGSDQDNDDLQGGKGAGENFAELFEESQKEKDFQEGQVLEGKIVAVGPNYVSVDVGFKCEGMIPLHEFITASGKPEVEIGSPVNVYIERIEVDNGKLY